MKTAGSCRSDLDTINDIFPPVESSPTTLSHEMEGLVAESVKSVKKVEIDDYVGGDCIQLRYM